MTLAVPMQCNALEVREFVGFLPSRASNERMNISIYKAIQNFLRK